MPAKKPKPTKPRILIVTPEITYLPQGMGNLMQHMSAKAGGLADVSAALPPALHRLGVDVRLLMPGYPAVLAALGDTRPVRILADLFGGPARLLRHAGPSSVRCYCLIE